MKSNLPVLSVLKALPGTSLQSQTLGRLRQEKAEIRAYLGLFRDSFKKGRSKGPKLAWWGMLVNWALGG